MSAVTAPSKKDIRAALNKAGLSKVDNDVLSKCKYARSHNLHTDCWMEFKLTPFFYRRCLGLYATLDARDHG